MTSDLSAAQQTRLIGCLEKGLARDVALFRTYGETFKGAHQLTWSRGLRGRYLPQPEPTDHDLAEDMSADDVARMRLLGLAKPLWRVIHARRLPAQVFEACRHGRSRGGSGLTGSPRHRP